MANGDQTLSPLGGSAPISSLSFGPTEQPRRSKLETIGTALQAAGAGFLGQGPQFQANLAAQKRQRSQDFAQELRARQQSLAKDALNTRNLLANRDVKGARSLLSERVNFINQLGGDPKDTQSVLNLLRDGEITQAFDILDGTVKSAQSRGFLAQDTATRLKSSEITPGGQIVELGPGGRPIARDISGFRAKAVEGAEQKQVNALRKDIFNVSKSFRQVEEANERIKKSGAKGTAASDISLIFNFMKINDPGSTVREGEFATAQNAAGVPDRAINLYNNLLKGTRLSALQRQDFISQSQTLFQGQRDATDNQIGNILQQADQDSIDRVRVFGKNRLADFNQRQVSRQTITAPQDQQPGGQIPTVTSQAEFDALSPGDEFIEDGQPLRKQ